MFRILVISKQNLVIFQMTVLFLVIWT